MILQESKLLKFLGFMWNPLSWVMEAAAVMAIVLANGGVRTPHTIAPIDRRAFTLRVATATSE